MITVVGGTYREIDYDDLSHDIFGSGFRGAKFLLENNCVTNFFTAGNNIVKRYLSSCKSVYNNFEFNCCESKELITFKYSFALDEPSIFPSLLNTVKCGCINVEAENIICYGMLECDFKLNGGKVIYDPQTSIGPIRFTNFGQAKELIYVVNWNEAKAIASSENIDEIKNYFFKIEKVLAFIIKNGPAGATLYYEQIEHAIPSFVTENVYKIGSGDIFTASFGYYWIEKNLSLKESAILASKSTSIYCEKKAFVDVLSMEDNCFTPYKHIDYSEKQVYLAAPFFSIADLILIDKVRNAFLNMGVKVFSPFHDVGLGDDITVANKDLNGIDESNIVFFIYDNLDSGTLIESGYALAQQKKMIGYHRTCDDSKLLMLKPANVMLFSHLTTAIYKTIWNL